MESKTILFTVDGDNISPRTEQKAGVQGNHNITEVRFEGDSVLSGAMENSENYKVRMQFIDGAGGFYSSGFLTVYSDETDGRLFVTCPIPNNVTNAGGLAYVYLVVTEIAYEGKKALESQVYISPPGKLLYTHSGVGSPSEYAYKVGITNALVNAEIFAGQAEGYANKSLGYSNTAGEYAENAASSAENAADSATNAANALQALNDGIASGEFKGDQGPRGPQGEKGDKGDKGEKGDTPDLTNHIRIWQPNTEYKVGDVVIAKFEEYMDLQDQNDYNIVPNRTVIAKCVEQHTSQNIFSLYYVVDGRNKLTWEILQETYAYYDALGRRIHNTYATKEELTEAIGEALEGDY